MFENIQDKVQREIFIKSLSYLPEFLQDKPVMKDAAKLLDACLSQETDVLAEIYQAYCDTLYKMSGYEQLSYAAKTELLKEKGFEYLLDILKHIYEDRYNQLDIEERKKISLEQYLEQQTANNLTNITMLFNLLYILKGKTLGLELALELVNCPEFIYLPWDIVANYKGEWPDVNTLPMPGGDIEVKKGDCYTVTLGEIKTDYIFNGVTWHQCTSYQQYLTPRQPFTAELTIWGTASAQLQARIAEFVRYYMLPWIEVKLEFTANMDAVYCFGSGDRSLLRTYLLSHYYDDNGNLIHHQLTHTVSDNSWEYTPQQADDITIGQPLFENTAFKGTVDLNNSFVERGDNKYYLYGQTKVIPEFITGPALDKLTDEGTLINFDGDYVQAPLKQDYVLVDIVTGEQINPHYDENGEFIRDTIIKYNTCLLVEGIHHAKTIEQMNSLLIEDFDRDLEETEVYAGRVTEVHVENPAGVLLFQTSTPYVREQTGFEPTIHLIFSDTFVEDYTGIGDLGILGANTYFIYNNMLFMNQGDTFKQIGDDETWKDIGASHAVSQTYYTPGVNNGSLVYVKDGEVFPLTRDESAFNSYTHHVQTIPMPVEVVDSLDVDTLDSMLLEDFKLYLDLSYWDNLEQTKWTHVTGYVNDYYTTYAICDGYLYQIYMKDGVPQYAPKDLEQGWTYITGAYYRDTYEAYGIKNGVMYTIGEQILPIAVDGIILSGWDSSFDCISRYHHSNNDYITYGICQGKLYYLQNRNVQLMSEETGWTSICGFYNVNSPRTFAYAIKNGVLYELQGTNLVVKDNTHNWTDISGCTTTTNTFVLAIADGNLYEVNAKNLKLIDEGGWTDVFGRTTTSNSKSADCYGYGIKNNRLVVLHKEHQGIVPGMWKKDGVGPAVDLRDYNITDIAVRTEDGYITGIDNVPTKIPLGDEPPSTYNIDITYETIGFEDNTRYQVMTSMSEMYNTYINPKDCRDNIYMDNAPEWNSDTGILTNFTECPLIIHGNQKINGNGEAYEFSKDSYLELPDYYNEIQGEFEPIYEYIPFQEVTLHLGAIVTDGFYPLVLDKNGQTGIYYGTNGQTGLFVKSSNSITQILSVPLNQNFEVYIKYVKSGDYYNIQLLKEQYETVFTSTTDYVNSPKYLGGNGTEFGDGIFFLLDSSMYTDKLIPMYQNGKYLSVDTLNMDLIERFITPVSQECQKVIEIQNENHEEIISLEMDSMYVSRTFDCTNKDLAIQDNFCYNELHYGDNEGINHSTLVFTGEYTLDPEKAQDKGNIHDSYKNNTIAQNFSEENYIDLNLNYAEPLVITTSDNVENQILFKTEEDSAFTNNYLLTGDISVTSSRDMAHVVPSGIMFELHTDLPGTVTKTLEYNADYFEVNEDLIQGWDKFTFNDYTAILSGFSYSQYGEGQYCTIPLHLEQRSQQQEENIITTNYDVLPILKVQLADSLKQKIGQFSDQDIIIGNKTLQYFNADGEPIDAPVYDEETGEFEEYTTEQVVDPDAYPYEDYTDYYLKFDIKTENRGIQNIILHETTSTEEKDKFTWVDGIIGNFKPCNYIITQNLTKHYGLTICYMMDDDVSKDQGLFGFENGQSICIKDNKFCLCDENGNIIEQSVEDLYENETYYIVIRTDWENPQVLNGEAHIYITDMEDDWYDLLFERTIKIQDDMWIGYASAGSGMLPFNGKVDLTRSYMENEELNPLRLFDFTQTTTIYASTNNQNYDVSQVIVTPYAEDTLLFGFNFNGSLDLYNSITTTDYGFLQPYILQWLENRIPIDTQIKTELSQADPTYDVNTDTNTYTIEEYGIHLDKTPERWDSINVTYTAEDHAYYMKANTKYYLKLETEIDDNGVCLLTKQGNPSWESAIISDFTENDYYSIDFTNEQYIVIHCKTTNIEDQALCGYPGVNTQKIVIKDGSWQYFDDTNYHVICNAQENTNYYFKLYTNSNNIEYSLGNNWIETDINASFTGYDTLYIGKSNEQTFKGSINLNDSFTITDDVNYLFTPYKKVTPYISTDNRNWTSIVLTPLLTLRNMIAFGQGFSGTVDLIESNLLLDDTVYWSGTRVNVYAMYDMPEDDIKANDLVRWYILDDLVVDPSKYWTEELKVKVNPEELRLHITGLPKVGDIINLTYDTWYLFREMNHEYDFKVLYEDRIKIAYEDLETGIEHVIYEMDLQPLTVNTGYNYWGSLSVKDSTRGGMTLCEYLEWYRYIVNYRKYGEEEWTKWSEFSVESRYELNKRTGYELDGLLYMESSYVKLGNLITPFLSAWNGTYITIVGGVSITDGIASLFTENDYLLMKMESLKDGDKVSFEVTFDSIENQGIGTLFYIEDGYICSGGVKLQKIYEGYKACIEYYIENGKVTARVVGMNSSDFLLGLAPARVLTIIPYNEELQSSQTGYYVKSLEDAQKLSVYYRVGDDRYDHFVPPTLQWYPVALQHVDSLDYYGLTLQNLYIAQIPLGYTYDHAMNPINSNPDDVKYLENQPIEYKIVNEDGYTTTNHTSLYADRKEKQRTKF